MLKTHPLFIKGRWVGGGGRENRPVIGPATGESVAQHCCASLSDADEAADAAARAFADWSRRPPPERADVLVQIAGLVRSAREEIAQEITREQGKPLREARDELDGIAGVFEYFSGVAASYDFKRQVSGGAARREIEMQAIGPVLIINTWNFPVETVASHLAPALAAGCTAVVLANRETPGPVAAFMGALAESGLPAGAVNLVMGQAAQLAEHLIGKESIRHVSYTGSVTVGKALAAAAGARLKRATLELGGNAPAIVMEDADIETAARDIAGKRFWNAGQVCTAPNRIYVHRSQQARFVDAVAAYAQGLEVGDGLMVGTDVGPMANDRRPKIMQRVVEDALGRGARFVAGSKAETDRGFYWRPTVLSDVPDEALGMREEIFGPVACITGFDEIDDVVARANDCPLGLSGYVHGGDPGACQSVAARLTVGSVGVNQMVTAFTDAPFGGVKDSGSGTIGGESALSEYLFPKLIAAKA